MANDVNLGLGLATGMFFEAPAGTELPAKLSESLPSTWKEIGDVTSDGITLTLDKSTDNLKNWANKIKRTLLSDHSETIQSPVMDTTEDSLKAVFGEANVTISDDNIRVNLSASELPAPKAYLWLMKDGEDMMAIGCSQGQITKVENVSFAPNAGITWTPTITAQGDGFVFIKE